jgi:hypothetical protein
MHLRIVCIVLLLQIPRRVLGVGCADAGADDLTRGRPDAGATAAVNRGSERGPETSVEESAANNRRVPPIA